MPAGVNPGRTPLGDPLGGFQNIMAREKWPPPNFLFGHKGVSADEKTSLGPLRERSKRA